MLSPHAVNLSLGGELMEENGQEGGGGKKDCNGNRELGGHLATQYRAAKCETIPEKGAAFALVFFFGWDLIAIVCSLFSYLVRLCETGAFFSHTTKFIFLSSICVVALGRSVEVCQVSTSWFMC